MKKWNALFLIILGMVVMSGCTTPAQTPDSSINERTVSEDVSQMMATITLSIGGQEVETKEVPFDEGDVLYDIMVNNFTVEVTDGLITSIDGHSQDKAADKYWMYDINGEMALKGAKDLTLKSGDQVLFKLEEMK